MGVIVKELPAAPGDFEVIRGGDVYYGRGASTSPGTVKAGDIVSASAICEWVENGALVEWRGSVAAAGFHTYADHHQGCAATDERHPAYPRPCDCGFEKVRAVATRPITA